MPRQNAEPAFVPRAAHEGRDNSRESEMFSDEELLGDLTAAELSWFVFHIMVVGKV
jgi:hypothetical protein